MHKFTPHQASLACPKGRETEELEQAEGNYYSQDEEASEVLEAGQGFEDGDDYDAEHQLGDDDDDYVTAKKSASRTEHSIFSKAAAAADAKAPEPVQMSAGEFMQLFVSQMKSSLSATTRIAPKNVLRVTLAASSSLNEFADKADEKLGGGVMLTLANKMHYHGYKDRRVRRVGYQDYTNKHGVNFGMSMPHLSNGAVEGTHVTDTGRYLAVLAANTQSARFSDPVIAFEYSGDNLRSVLLEKFPSLKPEDVSKSCFPLADDKTLVLASSAAMQGVWERIKEMKSAALAKAEAYTGGEPQFIESMKGYTMPSAVATAGVNFVMHVLTNSSSFDLEKDLHVVLHRAQSSLTKAGKTNIGAREKWLDSIEVRSSIKDGQALGVEFEKIRVVSVTAFVEFE